MEKWRLLDTGRLSAAENMALDDAMLECRSQNLVPNTLRFLQFNPPAVLVGFHQDIAQEVRLDYTRSRAIDINRRLTGGGTIFFDASALGWEIVASHEAVPTHIGIEGLFEKMCEGPVNALRELGINASFRPKNDIEVDGRKISGTGGVERNDSFLFQGTLLVDFDVETMIRALRIPLEKLKDKELKSAKQRVTSINKELGYLPKLHEIKKSLVNGFGKALGVEFIETELIAQEEYLLKEKLAYFQSDEWIYLDRRSVSQSTTVQAITKTKGGLLRVSLALDPEFNIVKSILITGDFFAFPSRAVLDLEAALKFVPCNKQEIQKTVEDFFATSCAHFPGITAMDLVDIIMEAAEKSTYKTFGLTLDETNHVYPITKKAKDILTNGYEYVLLPYCAKLPTCNFRHENGCSKCGKCAIGDIYKIVEGRGLKIVTIQNFENLMKTLRDMKKNQAKGWIGCCCEIFYSKHRDEIEDAGVPGIIIGIDDKTCYDLGKEAEAYKGLFEIQTQLNTALVSKLLNCNKNNGEATENNRF